jgi:long-chain acyl-CoA synthetase
MASLIYTSGTTGTPKGAILTHRNLTWTAQALLTYSALGPGDRIMSFLPLAHILERMFSHMRQVLSGCQVYFCPSIDQFLPVLREVRPTGFIGVPRVWEKIYAGIRSRMDRLTGVRRLMRDLALRAAERRTTDFEHGCPASPLARVQWLAADRLVLARVREGLGLDQSRIFVSTGAAISPHILGFFYGIGIEILELYGQTEVTGPSTTNRPGAVRFGTVGPPIPGVQIRIAEDGEVLVRGPNVFSGYFKDPKATADTLTDGWLRSGDIGAIDESGRLTITDRKKDLFKTSGGKYVAPGAIENMLKGRAGISQAVVLGDGRAYVAALLTLDRESPVAKAGPHDASVRRAVEEAVAVVNRSLSHPEQIKRWEILPEEFQIGEELTPTLKVKRKVVGEKYRDQIEGLYSEGGRGER